MKMFQKTLLFRYARLLGNLRANLNDLSELRELFLEEKKYCLQDMPFKDPFKIFKVWFQEARESTDIINPSIVCLATATSNGIPSLRYMLCDSFDEKGFRFFTHYTTRKGEELKSNPLAAMCFFWAPFLRTVRIEGHVEQLPDVVSDKLFEKRSYESQINMHCSSQTNRLARCDVLKAREKEIKKAFDSACIPRPDNFGWYLLKPTVIEFWQLKQRKERMRFRQPSPEEFPDELTHKGEKGWLYEFMEP